ncbi:MAG: SAM-dependent methyltransferase [Acidobacteria bacterium]|nr:MAG: SAM-dependent methyltransferase [Acidobacteriota bacterium]
MPFYRDHVYPRLVRLLGDPEPVREIRKRIVPLARGEVLKIGVGPGVNFAYYDPARVSKVHALEPNAGMIRLAERQRRRTELDIAFLDLPGEGIPLGDGSVDTVVSTFTLCTISGVADALRGVRRVLRPGGTLIFFEHGRSPDPRVRRWQEWTEPIPHWLFEGCHVTRDVPSLIEQAGFRIERMETAYLARFPKAWTHCWWGSAVPQPDPRSPQAS